VNGVRSFDVELGVPVEDEVEVARLDDAADDCADVELLRALLVLSLGAALDDDALLVFGDTAAEGGLRLVVVGRVWSVTRSGLVRIFRGRRRDDFGHPGLTWEMWRRSASSGGGTKGVHLPGSTLRPQKAILSSLR
jgi:hypothetical protein